MIKTELENDRRIYRALARKMTSGEKLWLLDVGGDYRRYVKRLHFLAKEYGIPISSQEE